MFQIWSRGKKERIGLSEQLIEGDVGRKVSRYRRPRARGKQGIATRVMPMGTSVSPPSPLALSLFPPEWGIFFLLPS